MKKNSPPTHVCSERGAGDAFSLSSSSLHPVSTPQAVACGGSWGCCGGGGPQVLSVVRVFVFPALPPVVPFPLLLLVSFPPPLVVLFPLLIVSFPLLVVLFPPPLIVLFPLLLLISLPPPPP